MLGSFDHLPEVVDDDQLHDEVSMYLGQQLSKDPSAKEVLEARARTILQFPELIGCYIRLKEDNGDRAVATSREKVDETQRLLRDQGQVAARDLTAKTDLFAKPWTSFDEAMAAAETFKHYVENHIEFKLAKSSSLERNLDKQVAVYEAANKTKSSVTVVICYTAADQAKPRGSSRRSASTNLTQGPWSSSTPAPTTRSPHRRSSPLEEFIAPARATCGRGFGRSGRQGRQWVPRQSGRSALGRIRRTRTS